MQSRTILLGATAGLLLGLVAPASAYVVCNPQGDCWHTHQRYSTPGVHLEYHPDDWYFHRHWGAGDRYHWHDYHAGRGYWRGGVWVTL